MEYISLVLDEICKLTSSLNFTINLPASYSVNMVESIPEEVITVMESSDISFSISFTLITIWTEYNIRDIITKNIESIILYLTSCYSQEQTEVLLNNYNSFKKYLGTIIKKNNEIRITSQNVSVYHIHLEK